MYRKDYTQVAASLVVIMFSVSATVWATEQHVYSWQKIQDAVISSNDGDEIIVHPGTYAEMVNFEDKNIIVRSTDPEDPEIVASTIIDGENSRLCVIFGGAETEEARLAGFTITRGKGFYDAGGIYGQETHATIEYNNITTNAAGTLTPGGASGRGGGIFDCDGLIQHNLIANNLSSYQYGGGGGLALCDGTIRKNRIVNNRVTGSQNNGGGGIYYCGGTITGNLIADNVCTTTLGKGGGLSYCGGTISNNVIVRNIAGVVGGGIDDCDGTIVGNTIWGNVVLDNKGGGLGSCDGEIRNNIVWGNSAPQDPQIYDTLGQATISYNCIEGGFMGTGNIVLDPLLVDPDEGDFHLSSDSPCIDAGGECGLSEDYDGDTRPMDSVWPARGDGSQFDIGADEVDFEKTATRGNWHHYR